MAAINTVRVRERAGSTRPEQIRRHVQGRDHPFSLNDTVTSVSFEAKANYLQPRRRGEATKEARLLQPFLARESSPEPANIQVDRQRRCDCVCTPIRDGGAERGTEGSDNFLARPRSSAHAVFLMKRTGLHTSLPGYKRQRRGQKPRCNCGVHASKLVQEHQQLRQPHQTKPFHLLLII